MSSSGKLRCGIGIRKNQRLSRPPCRECQHPCGPQNVSRNPLGQRSPRDRNSEKILPHRTRIPRGPLKRPSRSRQQGDCSGHTPAVRLDLIGEQLVEEKKLLKKLRYVPRGGGGPSTHRMTCRTQGPPGGPRTSSRTPCRTRRRRACSARAQHVGPLPLPPARKEQGSRQTTPRDVEEAKEQRHEEPPHRQRGGRGDERGVASGGC